MIPLLLYSLSGLCLLLYVVAFKNQFLIFHGGTFTQQVTVKGHERSYRDFMEGVLAQAEKLRGKLRRGKRSSTAPAARS